MAQTNVIDIINKYALSNMLCNNHEGHIIRLDIENKFEVSIALGCNNQSLPTTPMSRIDLYTHAQIVFADYNNNPLNVSFEDMYKVDSIEVSDFLKTYDKVCFDELDYMIIAILNYMEENDVCIL
jgi:hypothetical protein